MQNPVRLSDRSEPVEVSEASLRTDREVKLPLYARSGVPESPSVALKANPKGPASPP